MLNYYDEEIDLEAENSNIKTVPQENKSASQSIQIMSNDEENLHHGHDSFDSDSESDNKDIVSRELNSAKLNNLNISKELKECLQHILKYVPQTIDVETHLQSFIPEFIPAVGDVDAFLKVSYPETVNMSPNMDIMKSFGLTVLDEPSGHQSDRNLLHIKLRSVMKTKTNSDNVVISKSHKDIQRWIAEIYHLHMNKTPKETIGHQALPNIDGLMVEWPASFETSLNEIGLPSFRLSCSSSTYVKVLCALFDIIIYENKYSQYLKSLHVFFNLFLAINNGFELN